MKKVITFDDSASKDVLGIFDKKVDRKGYIIDKNTKEKVLAQDGKPIKIKEFAGIQGGELIRNDLCSLVLLSDIMKED